MEENTAPEKKTISDVVGEYNKSNAQENEVKNVSIPSKINNDTYENIMSKETDPDLITSYELIKLPSKGLFYENKISEVAVEYMTSQDEDILTTPSLIENGTTMDILLKRKIKTPNVDVEKLLPGDRNAIILFLRTSSYGPDYSVEVLDPRNNVPFKSSVNLLKLKYKEVNVKPDENGYFSVLIPMRKKIVKFRLISSGEDNIIFKKAESIQEAYGEEFNHYNTMKLKAHIVSINENKDRGYIDKFVDAMPALDAYAIRKEILKVQPDVDMSYEFKASDGFKFKSNLVIGADFFFPVI